ncbi:MAG: ABC transporter permease [Bifidobacterium breve]|nr:ABC transporter permease [Bifidobacterium breve]
MWTTFLVALKANLRNRSALFWMTVFPIVLATMFNGLFGGLAEAYELKPVPMAVIEDTRWQQADGARTFVDALAGETESASDDTTYAGIDQKLLTITTVGTVKEAEQRLADGTANGYLTADNNGRLAMTVSRETAVTAKDSTQNSGLDISLAALRGVIDLYNRTDAVTRQTIADNPQAALSRNFWNSVGQNVDMTHETTLTHFQPDAIARYYYALLAMSCMMAMGYSISTVAAAQANFLSCWLCSSVALSIALAYIRLACNVSLGGREPAAIFAVIIASFMTSSAGTLLGAVPKLSYDTKYGLSSGIACILSLFTGLYGGFAMQISDWIARNAPILGTINPAQQVTNLFYDILYYDSYQPFITTCAILLAMSAVFLLAGIAMLRRQRYEHL